MDSTVSMSPKLHVAAKFFSSQKYSHVDATSVCACKPHRTLTFCNFQYFHGIERFPYRPSQTKKQKPTLSH